MIKMKISEIFDEIPYKIFERGEDYYENDYILSLDYDDKKNIIKSKVEGSGFNPYYIKVEINNDDEIIDYYCNCPYDYGDICKHLVAVFLAINNGDHLETLNKEHDREYSDNISYANENVHGEEGHDFDLMDDENYEDKKLKDKDLLKLLQSVSKKELIDFIVKYSTNDKQLGYELSKKFTTDKEFDISKIKRLINESINDNYHGRGMDDNDSYYISSELEDILDEYENVLDKDNCNIIFNNTFEILIEIYNILRISYDHDIYSNFSDIIHNAESLLHCAAVYLEKHGLDDEKNNAFHLSIRKGLVSSSSSDGINFFELAAIFVNEDNKDYFYKEFNKFIEKNQGSYSLNLTEIKFIEKNIIEKLEGIAAAREFMLNNIHIDSFAKTIVDFAILDLDFKLVEEICLFKIKEINEKFPNRSHIHFLNMWYEYLFKIYQLSGEKEKEIEIIHDFLKNGEHKYYSVLKSLYEEEGIWDVKYKLVLEFIRKHLRSSDYMSILASEKEWGLLFKELKLNPSKIFTYGKDLAKICPDETFEIYSDVILENSAIADSRSKYRHVCDLIENLHGDGGRKKSFEIINYLKETYNRKPAFKDELNSLKRKLSKS